MDAAKSMLSSAVLGEARPIVSVIVTVAKRREYLLSAVQSVLDQSVPRDYFEVIVVGNTAEPTDREHFSKNGVVYLPSEAQGLGPKLSKAIRASRGSILVFLEDDDLFERNKLAEVLDRFGRDPSLGYYHNAFVPIGSRGEEYGGRFKPLPGQRRIHRLKQVYIPTGGGADSLDQLVHVFPSFNTSSISLRRDAVQPRLNYLEGIHLIVDVCLFYSAVLSGRAILVDDCPLTRLRLHGSSASRPDVGRVDEAVERLRAFSHANLPSREILIQMAADAGRDDVRRLLVAQRQVEAVILHLREPDGSRRPTAADLFQMTQLIDTFEVRSFLEVIPLGLVYLVSPRAANALYRAAKTLGF